MEKFVIKGNKPLIGEIDISGAKNAAVAILPATLLAKDVFLIENVPDIRDINSMLQILESMGALVSYANRSTVKIDTRFVEAGTVDYELTKNLRASYYLLGALLGMYNNAKVAMPGGCNFGGVRPIDLHLKGFSALGAMISTDGGMIVAKANKLLGASIYFDKVSVGATINVMLAAVKARGITIIENAAREPHIVDLANFLNLMGARIKGAGTEVIKIEGVSELHGCSYSIIPDQIEAGTYMVAAAATCGDLLIKNVIPKHLDPISAKLRECGASVEEFDDSIRVSASGRLHGCNIKTSPHPGFPTDMQPQFTVLLSLCEGISIVTDSVWDNRFRYVDQLTRMGAQIQIEGKAAIVQGSAALKGAPVKADDLRAGAAMIIAGLCAKGTTEIEDIIHIDRGYEDVVKKLTAVGATISRVDFPDPKAIISKRA
ncbi:MAG: UDP-N-acetylglucosamine 1-carboxyvinyltransferase [Clostridia bacterium]|nr:UDP-N-acetylglucosamine 1-carboxyvinyltransferase [Clostridia bacterium]